MIVKQTFFEYYVMIIKAKLKQFLKVLFFKIFPNPYNYKEGKKRNIFLFSSRRGGSTLLSEIIAQEPGLLEIHHPDSIHDGKKTIQSKTRIKFLPKMYQGQLINLNEKQHEQLNSFFQRVLEGKHKEMSRPSFTKKNRILLKLSDSFALADWYYYSFNPLIVHLLRHPIAQASSVIRNNWTINAEAYLIDKIFCAKYLNKNQVKYGKNVLNNGSILEKAVLNWVLENLYLLKHTSNIDLQLTYEELVLFPENILPIICDRLELHNISGMKKRITTPSKSKAYSDKKTSKFIRKQQRMNLINKWVGYYSSYELESIQKILNVFDIFEYSTATPFPHEQLFIANQHEMRQF